MANEAIGLLPKARRANRRCLILDIDSTHIDLYGNQENKSYNAHYQCNCLAPVLCYLNGWPVAIYGAAGTRDGRKVFEHQMVRFITRLKEFFPEYRIVLRGDSGFNSKYIIDTCDELGIFYIFGLSPNKKAQAIAKKGLTNSIQKEVRRYTTAGQTHRSLGEIDYHAKSWGKNKRRIVARKQFDPRTCQLDLRLIQTNIRYTDNETDKGYCGELSSFSPDKLYEKTYCGRGGMEKLIGEFKTECFGARASATRFTTNCYRMILSMFCQLVLKVARHFQLKGVRKNDKKAKEKSVRKFRRDVICVAAQLQGLGELSQMTLPAHLHDEQAYMAMLSIRI